jgi:hypothetical protein
MLVFPRSLAALFVASKASDPPPWGGPELAMHSQQQQLSGLPIVLILLHVRQPQTHHLSLCDITEVVSAVQIRP